jgi:hypothetical protein
MEINSSEGKFKRVAYSFYEILKLSRFVKLFILVHHINHVNHEYKVYNGKYREHRHYYCHFDEYAQPGAYKR